MTSPVIPAHGSSGHSSTPRYTHNVDIRPSPGYKRRGHPSIPRNTLAGRTVDIPAPLDEHYLDTM